MFALLGEISGARTRVPFALTRGLRRGLDGRTRGLQAATARVIRTILRRVSVLGGTGTAPGPIGRPITPLGPVPR